MRASCSCSSVISFLRCACAGVQVAIFVNGATHLVAGTHKCWHSLDALHLKLLYRLLERAKGCSAIAVQCDELDSSLTELLAFSESTSASARAYYLSRAAAHAAPEGCGLLFAAASAAHCDGSCTAGEAARMRIALIPHRDGSHVGFAERAIVPRLRHLALRVGSSREGPGSGALGCDCRVALCTTLAEHAHWPVSLLRMAPSWWSCDIAAQDLFRRSRRCVVAQVCANTASDEARHSTMSNPRLLTDRASSGERGMYLAVRSIPTRRVRKRYTLGCMRQTPAALAHLIVAAEAWVHGGTAWALPTEHALGQAPASAYYESGELDRSFGSEEDNWGHAGDLTHATLLGLGYKQPETDNLLLYAAVEDVDVERDEP